MSRFAELANNAAPARNATSSAPRKSGRIVFIRWVGRPGPLSTPSAIAAFAPQGDSYPQTSKTSNARTPLAHLRERMSSRQCSTQQNMRDEPIGLLVRHYLRPQTRELRGPALRLSAITVIIARTRIVRDWVARRTSSQLRWQCPKPDSFGSPAVRRPERPSTIESTRQGRMHLAGSRRSAPSLIRITHPCERNDRGDWHVHLAACYSLLP